MAEPFLGEIRIMSFSFPPKGWAFCNGQLLPINQNQGLFSLLGTTYGGDGRVNFALPNLQGRVPMHEGSGHTLGERAGEQAHTLSVAELPAHTHFVNTINATADQQYPTATTHWASGGSFAGFHQNDNANMDPGTILPTGGSQAHLNMQPYLALNFSIALQGIFPSQT
ncbi:MAG: phage tail protein [Sphingobacteriales bacterium]|nr:phage tail protein [Sphingobacteriales bacterium]MBI3716981.1 phage tail protein [Sphingobacteriales bacterium]